MRARYDTALSAAAFLGGCLVCTRLEQIWVGGLAIATLVAVAGRRRRGIGLSGWAILGVFVSALAWVEPARAIGVWDLDRPLRVRLVARGHWQSGEGTWRTRALVVSIRQGSRHTRADLPVWLEISADSEPGPADGYRAIGTLRPGSFYLNEPRPRAALYRMVVPSSRFLEPVRASAPGLGKRVRQAMASLLERLGEGPARGLAEALLLGSRDRLPEDWQRALRRLGLAHVMAVSGLHVGLLAWVTLGLGRALPPGPRMVVVLFIVWLYAAVVGPRPSVVRAAFMLSGVVLAGRLRRRSDALTALSLVVMGTTAGEPRLVHDVGFQLSALATAGVVALGPRFTVAWGLEASRTARAAAVTLAAQLATLPVTLPLFCQLPVGGALLNLLLVPWTALVLAGLLLWLVVAAVSTALGAPWIADLLVPVLDLGAMAFELVSALPPHPLLSVPFYAPFPLVAVASVLVVWVGLRLRARLWIPAAIAVAVLGLRSPERGVEIVALDVGQGDAVLLRDGSGAILVDGGGWRRGDFAGRVLVPALARLGVRRLDAVVVTHSDTDHCAGILGLVDYLPVDELWVAPAWRRGSCVGELMKLAYGRKRILWKGDRLRWRGFAVDVLHPPPVSRAPPNDRSLVLRARSGDRSVLLLGDVSRRVEVLLDPGLLQSRELKVAHHGSATSTSSWLLERADARRALLSAGRNNAYGHPAAVVISRLEQRRMQILRTDLNGRIRVRWRGSATGIEVIATPVPGTVASGRQRILEPSLRRAGVG